MFYIRKFRYWLSSCSAVEVQNLCVSALCSALSAGNTAMTTVDKIAYIPAGRSRSRDSDNLFQLLFSEVYHSFNN